MINFDFIIRNVKGEYFENFNLAPLLHYQCGGPADLMFYPETKEDCVQLIKNCNRYVIPFFILGKGSNILISEKGFRGVVISLEKFTNNIEKIDDNSIYCGSSIILWDLVKYTMELGIGDMSSMSWIPGTVGGALFMNAGAFGTEIEQFVEQVDVITNDGEMHQYDHFECIFTYRSSSLQDKIILGAKLKFKTTDLNKMYKNSLEIIAKRQSKQPLDYPSCGSVFKRPTGMYAGTLIEECGLKGYSIGGARVSEKHANFIVNVNNASSDDIYALIKHIQKTVLEMKNVQLEREVRLIGFAGEKNV